MNCFLFSLFFIFFFLVVSFGLLPAVAGADVRLLLMVL